MALSVSIEKALQANHFKETASIVGTGQIPGIRPRNKAGFQKILRVNMNVPTHAGSHKKVLISLNCLKHLRRANEIVLTNLLLTTSNGFLCIRN